MKCSFISKAIGLQMLILAPVFSVQGAPLTPDQALRRIQGSTTMSRIPGKATTIELAHTEDADGSPMLFVFNTGNQGFVIASADDELPAILGYSDNGAFDPANASPELKWWLGQYAEEASYYLHNNTAAPVISSKTKQAKANRPSIPEMLTTKWNQGKPYNLCCPNDGSGVSVTGCVATAMAQLIKYHAYPTQGSGEHSYNWNGTTLTYDYGNATFNYADMLDDYYMENSTEAQQKAVAELMYACGVGVNMDYSSGESGAGDMYIPYALKTFFNYDVGTRLLKRNCFSTEEWEDLVYGELADNRPVIYGGQAPDGGHEFVCDGYDNGYFHINWGWSGMGDGYFLLSALDPGLQGIGGFSGGYNSEQAMICGAKPSQEGGTAWYPIYATAGMEVSDVRYSQAILKFNGGGIYNYSPEAVTLSFYLKAVSEAGEEYLNANPKNLTFGGATGLSATGYSGFGINYPEGLEAGNYKVYLVFQTPEGNWQDVKFPLTLPSYIALTVGEDGSYEFTQGVPVVKSKIKVTEFAPESTVLSGVNSWFYLTVENIGDVEFSGALIARAYEKESRTEPVAENTITGLSIASGQVFNGSVRLAYTLPDGDYDVVFYDPYGEVVSDVFALKIGKAPIEVERIILDSNNTTMEVDGTLQLTATVLPEDASDKSVVWSSSNTEVANVDQTGLVTAFTPGTTLITVTSAANEKISVSCMITVKEKSIEVSGIVLDKTEATLTEGETLALTATVDPEDATDKTLTWISSNDEVATVKDGVVTALKPGKATITVSTANGKTASCEITVEARVIYVTSITLDPEEIAAVTGSVIAITATVMPEDASDKTLIWTSSDETVATVVDGVVTIQGEGSAIITAATADGSEIKAECHVAGISWVDAIDNDASNADVYTVDGMLIKKGADMKYISKLAKGTYIIRIGNVTKKIIIV